MSADKGEVAITGDASAADETGHDAGSAPDERSSTAETLHNDATDRGEALDPPGGLHNPTKEVPLGDPPGHASRIVGG